LAEDNLQLMTQLINSIHETGQRAKDFTKATMIAFKQQPTIA
jgi:hypothetical protein